MGDMHQSSSTRAELLKSWAEIAQLRDEKEVVMAQNVDLVCELEASRQREEDLRKRLARYEPDDSCGEHRGFRGFMQRQSSQIGGTRRRQSGSGSASVCSVKSTNTSFTTSAMSISSCPPKLVRSKNEVSGAPRPAGNSAARRLSWGSRDSFVIEGEAEKLVEELTSQIRGMEEEQKDIVAALELKINCRDAVLHSMERTQKAEQDTLERLRESLKKRDARTKKREAELNEQIAALKAKLKEKRLIIEDQKIKINHSKAYVEALTSKVERIVKSHRVVAARSSNPPQQSRRHSQTAVS